MKRCRALLARLLLEIRLKRDPLLKAFLLRNIDRTVNSGHRNFSKKETDLHNDFRQWSSMIAFRKEFKSSRVPLNPSYFGLPARAINMQNNMMQRHDCEMIFLFHFGAGS